MIITHLKGKHRSPCILWMLCTVCACTILTSNAWATDLEELEGRIEELESTQKDMQAKDAADAEWTKKMEMGYNKGLYIKTVDGKYLLRLHFLLQPQYRYIFVDGGRNTNTFLVRHAQMRFFGNVFDPRLSYRVMFEMPGTAGGSTFSLRDLWVEWQANEHFHIRLGQMLYLIDYENVMPTWALQFVDRSIVNFNTTVDASQLGFEREMGLEVHGRLFSKRLDYLFYVVNGDGRNQVNMNSWPAIALRLVFNILGDVGGFISDVHDSKKPNLAIGIAGVHEQESANVNNNRLERVTGEIAFRYHGFSFLGEADMAYNATKGVKDVGYLAQAGAFIIPKYLEIAGRWAKVFKNGALGTDTVDQQEATGVMNYYFKGQNVKIQTEYSMLWNNGGTEGQDDHRIRCQVQLFF